MTRKVIIAGGRDFTDYETMQEKLDQLLWVDDVEIVSGGAKGADALGERYAADSGYPVKVFPANWDRDGKAAGFIRNQEMSHYADELIAFWDGKSPGTKNMIEKMVNAMKPTHIYFYGAAHDRSRRQS